MDAGKVADVLEMGLALGHGSDCTDSRPAECKCGAIPFGKAARALVAELRAEAAMVGVSTTTAGVMTPLYAVTAHPPVKGESGFAPCRCAMCSPRRST